MGSPVQPGYRLIDNLYFPSDFFQRNILGHSVDVSIHVLTFLYSHKSTAICSLYTFLEIAICISD